MSATAAPPSKPRVAALSIASNSTLILLKVVAGTLTGSVAILTEAVHSSVDLVASIVAFVSVRISGEPADADHRYGHDKFEDLAAMVEALLILVGSAAIAFSAVRRLIVGGHTHTFALGIAVIGVSAGANLVVSVVVGRGGVATGSPALAGDAAHLRTDALSSVVVLVALVLVDVTGAQWLDPVAALIVAGVIVSTGLRLLMRSGRVLVDQSLPGEQLAAIEQVIHSFAGRGVVGYHELRTRRAGSSRRYVDVHIQFRGGTSLEQAHLLSHQLQDEIAQRLGGADVLVHLEPESRMRPGQEPLRASS